MAKGDGVSDDRGKYGSPNDDFPAFNADDWIRRRVPLFNNIAKALLNEKSPFAVIKSTCAHSINTGEKTTSVECGECVTVNGNKLPLFEFRKIK